MLFESWFHNSICEKKTIVHKHETFIDKNGWHTSDTHASVCATIWTTARLLGLAGHVERRALPEEFQPQRPPAFVPGSWPSWPGGQCWSEVRRGSNAATLKVTKAAAKLRAVYRRRKTWERCSHACKAVCLNIDWKIFLGPFFFSFVFTLSLELHLWSPVASYSSVWSETLYCSHVRMRICVFDIVSRQLPPAGLVYIEPSAQLSFLFAPWFFF